MKGVNKVILVATVGKDPEIRYTTTGAAVANFSVAVNESYKDKTGSKQEKTEWIKIVSFNKLAEIVGEYVSKGTQVYIEGRIQTRAYDDKDGTKKYTTEVVADKLQMLGGGSTEKPTGKDSANASVEDTDDVPF